MLYFYHLRHSLLRRGSRRLASPTHIHFHLPAILLNYVEGKKEFLERIRLLSLRVTGDPVVESRIEPANRMINGILQITRNALSSHPKSATYNTGALARPRDWPLAILSLSPETMTNRWGNAASHRSTSVLIYTSLPILRSNLRCTRSRVYIVFGFPPTGNRSEPIHIYRAVHRVRNKTGARDLWI